MVCPAVLESVLFTTAVMPPHTVHALCLSQPGDGLKVPDTAILNVAGDITVEAWIRPRPAKDGPFNFILSKNYGGTGYALLIIGSGDNVRLQFEANDTVAYFIPMHVLTDHWWHVAGVLRSRQDISLYLNGVQVNQHPTDRAMAPSSLPLFLGTSPWNSFSGDMADVRIWNAARNQEQIVQDMTQPPDPSEKDLVADWTFKKLSRGRSYDVTHHTRPAEIQGHPRLVGASLGRGTW